MKTITTLLALILRALRPSRGLHAAPRAMRRDVRDEARASRVRRYANPRPALPSGPGFDAAANADAVPLIPGPRRPADTPPGRNASAFPSPALQTQAFESPTTLVRGYYLAHEARQRIARRDTEAAA